MPGPAFKAGEEAMLAVAVLGEETGEHPRRPKASHHEAQGLENYIGERARRGSKLPRISESRSVVCELRHPRDVRAQENPRIT